MEVSHCSPPDHLMSRVGRGEAALEHLPGLGSQWQRAFARALSSGEAKDAVKHFSASLVFVLCFFVPFNGNGILGMEQLVMLLAAAASPLSSAHETPLFTACTENWS